MTKRSINMADGPRGGVMLFLALFSIFIGQIQSQGDFDGSEFGIGRSPVDLVFVYDTSQLTNTTESLDEETMVKQFFSTFLESADVASGAVKVAFLTYSTHPEIVFNLDDFSTKEDMNDAIFGADFTSGERNTADALALVRSKVLVRDRKDVPNVVLLVQTGKSNRNEYRTVQEAEALKYARANIFVVGYGLDTSAEEEVNEIASKPIRENTFLMGSVYELDIVKEIVFAQIFTRAEQAFNSPAAGSESLDLVFLVHFSNTMKKEEHQRILEFMKAIVQYASIDDDKLRVGAVVYRKKAVPLFDFNAYTTKDQVIAGIDQISYNYRAKAASVASGFETVGSSLLVDSAGYRRDVPNLVILITDANADTDIIDTIPAAEKLKASGTTIFTVGINVTYNDELSAIASSQAYTLFVDDSKNLQGKDYVLQDQFVGLRTEDLPLIIPAFESTTTTTVTPSTSTEMLKIPAINLEEKDVVVAIHVSHNVNIKDIKNKLIPLMTDLVSSLDIDSGAIRFSLIVFGKDSKVEFGLNKYTDSKKLVKALKKSLKPKTLRSKGADVVKALNLLQTDVLVQKAGDRPDINNLLLVITDSASTSDLTDLIQESASMKRSGTQIFAIGINGADEKEIETLASDPTSTFSFIGKSYDDFTKSTILRERLTGLTIFEKLKAAKSDTTDKSKTTKAPKETQPPKVPKTPKPTKPAETPKPTKPTKPSKATKEPKKTKRVEITTTQRTTTPIDEDEDDDKDEDGITTDDITTTTGYPLVTTPSVTPLAEAKKADIVIAVHFNPRGSPFDFASLQQFLKKLISNAEVEGEDVQIGLMFYAADPEVIFHINQYQDKETIYKEIDGLRSENYRSYRTDASGALALGRQMLSIYFNRRTDVPAALIFVTDEPSDVNVDLLIEEKENVVNEGIQIYAVGIGMKDSTELETLASSRGNTYMVQRYGQLSDAADELHRQIRALSVSDEAPVVETTIVERTTVPVRTTTTIASTPTPKTPKPKTTKTATIPPTLRTTTQKTTTTRIITTEVTTEKPVEFITLAPVFAGIDCLTKTDLVFILDASTSVTETNFQKMRDFLKDFLKSADVNSGSARIGINIYSTDVQVIFHLNQYSTEAEILRAIDEIPYIYGSTNTADALKVMSNEMFVPARGDRPDAPNIVMLITDGISNINSRRTIPEAEAARAKGILIYVIGITLTDTREVEAIATPPASKNLFSIQSFDELVGLRQRIFSSVCPEKEEDLPPTANAGKDVVLQLPDDVVLLAGDKSTDDVAIVKYTWTQIGGPKVQVSPSDNPYLELRNLKEGTYLIELKVEDGKQQIDTDTVTITVLPEPDLPPVANAGPDKTIQLPEDSVELSGAKSTDDKGIVSYEWELTSPRDRTVVLRGTNSVTLNVDNLKEGDYTFTLSVRDKKGQLDTDTATVKVLAARDLPPVANAGRDYELQLPSNSVTLDGSKSTDDIGVVTYAWTMVSGDSRKVTMSGTNGPMLRLDNLGEGDYVFRLVVGDKLRQTSSDEARVSVKRAVKTSGYDVIFILDSSVAPNHFRWMTEYARAMIREMSIDDEEFRVGYLIYSNGAYRQFDLSDHTTRADVLAAVDKVGYRPGNKNTASAFKFVRKQMFTPSKGDRDFAKNYVVHLTGGDPSINPFESALEACQMQNEGVGMFAVGFGEVSDRSELDAHSSLPTSDYELIVGSERDIGEQPGLMLYQLKRGTPRPTPCPVPTTTQRPVGPIKCTSSGDVIFILDSSGSVGQDNFYRVLNFTYTTVDGLDIDNGRFRIGVTTFSDTSRLDFNLNEFSTKRDIEQALSQRVVYMYGNTHTAHALRRARLEMFTEQAGDRPDVPNVIVIITDGQSNVNHELTIPEARHLKANGVTILTVAVGFTSETSELVGLTSPPLSENLIYVADYESLAKLKDQLVEPLCTDSNMCRNNPCQNGAVCMDGIRSFVCLCQPDFFGDTCGKRCGDPADVVIVLDSSDTVGQYNFGRLKEYAEHLVREMNKDSCDINLGFMKYSSAAMVQVNLGMHTDTETNIRALESISYSRGRANMAAAFTALRERMFNRGGGDRPDAKNIAYFLTDGTNDVHAEMAEPEAEHAISEGIRIIPIGINLRERFELDNIAQSQGLQVIEINDEPGLIENTDVILRPLYEGNDFCAENPCSNSGRCVNEPFGFSCDCPIGYTGDTCQKRCSAKGDVVFAVDTSRYVTRKELKQVRRFLRSVVKRMKFNRNEFSVGMVQFTDYAKVTLDFDEGSSKRNIRSQIAGLRVHGGDPDPATALAKANVRIFNGRGGSRDKPDYLILVTKSMRNEINVLNEANKLKAQGTRILGVGIGLTGSEKEALESAVSMPYSDTAMFANDVKELDDIADKIVEFMCDHEDLCAENPCRNGGTCQRMGGEFYCECGVGYAGRYCENRCEARADIIFLLDSSGSVGHADFRSVKEFVHRMVGDLQIGKDKTRVGLVTFSSQSRHGFFMSSYTNVYELQNAIAGIGYEYGNTNTADGLRRVRERYFGGQNGDRSEIQNFLVVITDGVSNVQPDQTLVEAQLLKDMGVHIYAVGIGQFDPTEINGIASNPASQNAFVLSDFKALANISSSIVKKTCRDPTVCDENPCKNGGLCVPGINGPFCECRAGYRGEYCQESCVTVKDIYFLLDSSDSVGNSNFQTALNFTASIVEEFSSKDSHNRFALLTYSTDVQIVFSLGRYDKLPVIKNAIKYTRYRPGNTNLAGAFRVVKEIAVNALGDRSDAEDIIFVIADGNGNVDDDLTVQSAEELKKGGARIIPIAVNMNDYKEMEQIASAKNDLFKVSNYNSLPSVVEDIVRTTCKNGNVIRKE